MDRTAVVFSPEYYRHYPGKNHPESARRLSSIIRELKQGQLSRSKNWRFVTPWKGTASQVKLVHNAKYVRSVEGLCRSGGGLLDSGNTVVSPESYEVALCAAGGTLKAVSLVVKGQFENAFALVRPPGHHAGKSYGFGFCVFNNAAIAARCLVQNHGLKRVLILDIDAHHGNGTQDVFYRTNKILYLSLHEDPRRFPGTGFSDEVGEQKGRGYNVNIPLPFRTNDRIYLKAIEEVVKPIVLQYSPQFIIVSAGLDSHYADPVGCLSLSSYCYEKVFDSIVNLALKICQGKLVLILEGGYNINWVGKIAGTAIAKMSGTKYLVDDHVVGSGKEAQENGEMIIKEVKRVQRDFWNLK